MAELTETIVAATNLVSRYKLVCLTCAPGSASDTVVLLQKETQIQSIAHVIGAVITAGADANLLTAHVTFSGLTLTIVTKGADGNAATDWTGAALSLTILGNM